MPPKRRAESGGCWTCKARRKKCDEIRPSCGNCDTLKIECNYGSKPSWMDGGDRQRRKTATLKNEIKRNAAHKREKAHISDETAANAATHQFDVISDMTIPGDTLNSQPTPPTRSSEWMSAPEIHEAASCEPTLISSLPWSHQEHQRSNTLEGASASEIDFIMKYLDFVFPALFPFHQSHLFESGRSWLLLLLRKSRIAYHATLSLSCYYFTLALTDAEEGTEHAACKQLRWEEVEKEIGKCFDSLRAEVLVLSLNSRDMSVTILEKVELISSIIQVVIFEITVGSFSPWNTHLSAAITLFEEIMVNSEARLMYRGQPQSKFASILLGIGEPLWTNPGPSNHIWSTEQAGFRLCAGLLIFMDAIASTTTQETPRLLRYHSEVLSEVDDGLPAIGDARVRLSSIVGCRNGVVRSIANISTLVSWKRSQQTPNHLPDMEVVDHPHKIANDLEDIRNCLTAGVKPYGDCDTPFNRSPFNLGLKPSCSSVPNLIWAAAAQLYLSTAFDGWQLTDTRIRTNVSQITELFRTIPSDQLRTLAWPFCIAGCLALEHERPFFTTLVSKLGRVHTAGALNDAREIMERVWQNRPRESWDLASCFAILGSPMLLV